MSESHEVNQTKQLGLLIGAIALYFILSALPVPAGLSDVAFKAIVITICAVVIWALDILPVSVSSIFFTLLPAVLHVVPLPKALGYFATPSIFFVFGMFLITISFQNSGVSRRIVLWTTLKSGGKPERFLLLIMMMSAILSSFLADIPVCAMMFPIALVLLESNGCKPGQSQYGRAVMLGVPIACLIGGVGTPSGSAMNMLTLGMLKDMAGINITFFKWMCFGMPMVLILTPIAWYILIKVYKSEISSLSGMEEVKQEYQALGAMTPSQIRFVGFLVLNFIFWLSADSLKIPLPVAALMGSVIFVIPKFGFINWEKDKTRIGWDVLMIVGACNALGMIIFETGGAEWFVKMCLGGLASFSPVLIILIISGFTILAHLLVPVNSALVAVLLPPLVVLANETGINPAFFAIPLGFSVSASLLLPLDPVPLVTYPARYYRMMDMLKPGIWISIAWMIVMTVIMLILAKPLGFM